MHTVRDYRLPVNILRAACKANACAFVDVPVLFDTEETGFANGHICVGHPNNLACTLSRIVFIYLSHFEEICGVCAFQSTDQENATRLCIAAFLRSMAYGKDSLAEAVADEPIVQRLYQSRLPWLIMSDIIAPAYSSPVCNHKVIISASAKLDIAVFAEGDDDDCIDEGCTEDAVFVNSSIEYKPCSDAAFLIASIECHGLLPSVVVSELLESDILCQLRGVAQLAYKSDDEVDDFMAFLSIFSGGENKIEDVVQKAASGEVNSQYKEAQQNRDYTQGSWWFFGLIERMLEGVRGSDWSTYERLEPYWRELWNEVESVRVARGLTGLTYEALLRVKDGDNENEVPQTLEGLLGTTRVW